MKANVVSIVLCCTVKGVTFSISIYIAITRGRRGGLPGTPSELCKLARNP